MIYTLLKANFFMKEFIGGFSTDISLSSSTFANIGNFIKGGVKK